MDVDAVTDRGEQPVGSDASVEARKAPSPVITNTGTLIACTGGVTPEPAAFLSCIS